MVIKICRVCGRPYEAYDTMRNGRGTRRKFKRPHNSVTCSKICSRLNMHKEESLNNLIGGN